MGVGVFSWAVDLSLMPLGLLSQIGMTALAPVSQADDPALRAARLCVSCGPAPNNSPGIAPLALA